MTSMHICTSCQGHGKTQVLAKIQGRGCELRVVPCFSCGGTGQRSDEDLARMAAGKQLFELRKSLRLTQREVAAALKLQPAALNAMEFGKGLMTVAVIQRAQAQLQAWADTQQQRVEVDDA